MEVGRAGCALVQRADDAAQLTKTAAPIALLDTLERSAQLRGIDLWLCQHLHLAAQRNDLCALRCGLCGQ